MNGQCSHHIETSQLICPANQLTGFYMMGTLAVKELTDENEDFVDIIVQCSRQEVSGGQICVLKNFTKFTGNHMCWSFFLIKLWALRPAALLKRDSNTDVFL